MRARVELVSLFVSCLLLGASAVSAQDDIVIPAEPYTPPTVWSSPRTFQHTPPPQASDAQQNQGFVDVPVTRGGHWGRGGIDVGVPIQIPMTPTPPQSQAQLTSQIVGEFSECLAYGTNLILDCLRQNHDSVTIRKLQACLQSDVIPPNPADVQACLAAGNW